MFDPILLIRQFYTPESKLYNILVSHSLQVRDKSLDIALKHPELNLNTTFLEEAALIHDIGIFLTFAPGIECYGEKSYLEHGYLGADLVRNAGYPVHAQVCERHTGIGFSKKDIILQNLPLPHRDMIPESLEEKVICYADKFFSKTDLTHPHSTDKIKSMLRQYREENVQKFCEWHELFG